MAYMKDSSGRRLDSFPVQSRIAAASVLPGPPISSFNIAPFAEFNSGSAGGYTFGASYKVTADAVDLQLVYLGWQTTNSLTPRESGISQAVPIKASIEVNGSIFPVSFGPALTGTLDRMGALVSTPLGIRVNKGDTIRVRTFTNVASGLKTPKMMEMGGGPGHAPTGDGYATSDVSSGGSLNLTTTGGFTNPILCGQHVTPAATVFGLGDSITSGQADVNGGSNHNRNYGYFNRGLASAQVGGVRVAAVSLKAQDFAVNFRWPTISTACTHAFLMLGRNDLNGARTQAEIQADLTTIITQLKTRGLPVYVGTIPPYTSSNNGWSTVGGQTKISTEAARVAINDWIRSLPLGIAGCVDVADTLEVDANNVLTRNGGYWRVPTSTLAISSATLTSNVATVVTSTPHGLGVGQGFVVAGSGASFNGAFLVASVVNSTTFTYAVTAADTTSSAGTVALTYTPDGIHPDNPGHVAMAAPMQAMAAALTV